jgi:arylsulfatase
MAESESGNKSARKHCGVLLASTSLTAALAGAIAMATVTLSNVALAQNIRGSATGPTTAAGYDHADQYLHVQDIKPADNMYPVVQHPGQDRAAQAKLAALAAKTGKKPNIIVFLMDDVGWWDPGFNGGGLHSATPRRSWTSLPMRV